MERKCLGKSEGLTFWLAQPDDYEDVMSISEDIYGGNDYLPHRYHEWMEEPERTVILARREGKLVALESGLVVDEGATLVLEGLRVCSSERGRGVAGVIQRFADSYIQQQHPTIKMKRMTRGDDPGPEKLAKFILLARRAVLPLCGEAESFDGFISFLKNKLQSPGVLSGLVPLDETQLKRVLLDHKLPSRVQLPGGAIIQDWQPLRPMEGNLAILRRRGLTWLADSQEAPVFLSFYSPPYPIPYNGGSLRFNIDMFGTDPVFAQCALVGLIEAVLAKGELKGSVKVFVYMDQSLRETLQAFCEGHQGVMRCREPWKQLFLEREI
ncbi:N-acetyltransferase 16, like [Centroberyx affinis]|uniref:N-acetyltransferase 16, like n=1 Tax=Centroberyx affinis TaxID=166261 RepID=UPI003A5BB021